MSDNDPALQSFNPTWEYVKHTAMSAIKGAIKGALIIGAVVGIIAMIPGFGGGVVGSLMKAVGMEAWGGAVTGKAGAWVLDTLIGGALFGAQVGGLLGGGMGLLGAGDAVEEKRAHMLEQFERNQARANSREMMNYRMNQMRQTMAQQGAGMGVAPTPGLGMARPAAGMGVE